MNNVCMIGNLTRDPEARTTGTGKSVVSFSIAVTKRFKPQDGSADSDFFRCTAWGSTADFVSKYLSKGRKVSLTGRLEQRQWTDKEGNKRESVEIVCEDVQGLDKPASGGSGGGQARPGQGGTTMKPTTPAGDEYDPFAED